MIDAPRHRVKQVRRFGREPLAVLLRKLNIGRFESDLLEPTDGNCVAVGKMAFHGKMGWRSFLRF